MGKPAERVVAVLWILNGEIKFRSVGDCALTAWRAGRAAWAIALRSMGTTRRVGTVGDGGEGESGVQDLFKK